jgi:hypothetical protein
MSQFGITFSTSDVKISWPISLAMPITINVETFKLS